MSTTSPPDEPDPQLASSSRDSAFTSESLKYAITHVFFTAQPPQGSDHTPENDHALASAVCAAARANRAHICEISEQAQWDRITKMLDNLQASVQSQHVDDGHVQIISQLREIQTGDILVFFIRHQNAGITLTKRESLMLCEAFELSPSQDAVEKTEGPLTCSYPQSSVEIPLEEVEGEDFQFEFAKFLSRSRSVGSDFTLPPPSHPQYIVSLLKTISQSVDHTSEAFLLNKRATSLSGFLRGLDTVDVSRVTKRVHDHVDVFKSNDWRRSPLWLFIRVMIQMTLQHTLPYKWFILSFLCILATDGNNTSLSSNLLHLMSARVVRRLSKLGASAPDWLSEKALKTCFHLREILDTRWKELHSRSSPFRNPSQDELARDTQLSLLNSREYINDVLERQGHASVRAPFSPTDHSYSTLENFLSSNGAVFDEAYNVGPSVALYDFERSVEQDIDDWLANVTNVDEACCQLEIMMDTYMNKTLWLLRIDPEDRSARLLTGIELYVALDKLAVREIPMLTDYAPEIPLEVLQGLLLRKKTSLHRLSCAYQYFSLRHCQSRQGWSVLSDEFTEDSFPVRYYDHSLHLQRFKTRIEQDTTMQGAGCADLQSIHGHHLSGQRSVEEGSKSPLPVSPLHAKVVAFELQCPPCIRAWRSAAPRILQSFHRHIFDSFPMLSGKKGYTLLAHVPELQSYMAAERRETPLKWQIHLAYLYPKFPARTGRMLHYVLQDPLRYLRTHELSLWLQHWYSYYYKLEDRPLSSDLRYTFEHPSNDLEQYINSTLHTSNDVLSAQARCPTDLSLNEFVTFAHLRSGGSLQWFNILQGLRSRSLNLRRHHVHYLLTQAAMQVGPLDVNTATWIWHEEPQEPSFVNALLDEMDSLLMDVGAGAIDSVLMNSISLLLTRMLASSPSQDISERTISLLRRVRQKTFSWVQELSYEVFKAPMNEERKGLLRDMAATCRSTFNVDPVSLCNVFRSAEDIDAVLSCAFFMRALPSSIKGFNDKYAHLLLGRDSQLSPALDDVLRDVILADPSDHGIDLAVGKIFATYRPGTCRWEQLQDAKAHWFTCQTQASTKRPSRAVHISLLDGKLVVDGRTLGGLPPKVRSEFPQCEHVFRDQGFLVLPSDFPGMDLTMFSTSKYKVHFSLREDDLVLQAQSNETNEILQLIPSKILMGDIPSALLDDHVHWLNVSTKTIEIRPLERLWEDSTEHWKIDCASGQYRMYKGRDVLVDIRSATWAMVSKCFECLNNVRLKLQRQSKNFDEQSQFNNLLVTVSPFVSWNAQSTMVSQLCVTLPRYALSFSVNEREELESCDFKGMVYDENQSIGTLFGLENLLVLRQKTYPAEAGIPETLVQRRIIVPNGHPTIYSGRRVLIDVPFSAIKPDESLYHTYNVDDELGCLIGDGTLKSTRFLAYLHAMTNCHRPDPLTSKSGAQTALCLLRSAGCRSIMKQKAFDTGAGTRSWTSTQYPQINAAYEGILKRYYWDRSWYGRQEDLRPCEKNAACRADYLFPSYSVWKTFPEGRNESCRSTTSLSAVFPLISTGSSPPTHITLDHLISNRPTLELPARIALLRGVYTTSSDSDDSPALDKLFSPFPTDPFQKEYLNHLLISAQHAPVESRITYVGVARERLIEELKTYYVQCRVNYMDALNTLKKGLGPTTDPYEQAFTQSGQWPPITGDVLLRYLASTSPAAVSPSWKKCLTSLALFLLDVQRARRLLRFALDGLEEELGSELENEPCDGWDPADYPDWLLIQIQGNFLIRRIQAETAMQLMRPQSGENTVMQVNMGEGKSSVIIPIAAAALADGKQLVRVVVPKALTVQMFELLVARLGGLAHRPIYHLPFSRTPKRDGDGAIISLQIDDLHALMSCCMAERGIVLVQPEHVVSLKLMGVEEQIRGGKLVNDLLMGNRKSFYTQIQKALLFQQDNASKWLNLLKWLHSHARDVLDESDEILHSRFQLVYTTGSQRHMDGYPGRWTLTQQVLRLVKKHVSSLSKYSPDSIEYEPGIPGSFPHIRILRPSDVGLSLISMIRDDVMAGQLPNFNFEHIPSALRDAIRSFISDSNVYQVPETVKRVEEYAKDSNQSHLWSGLLLLRGLLTSNILLSALAERRWRVDYGLAALQPQSEGHAMRLKTPATLLAVPYRAKDVPAPNTQFGHPDFTIVLTCLSYYYAGLTKDQLRHSFEILQDQDDPSTEYGLWIKEHNRSMVSDSLRKLSNINLRSSEQWDNITFPLFSRNQATVDFYLSQVVFPKEAKEFPEKLSASSWDLAEKREKLVTGFSGTNDERWLLPLTISQCDPDHQKGNNARILAYLLRPGNSSYMVASNGSERLPSHAFLLTVAKQKPEVRVLLDVGSQILDLFNREVAKTWLEISHGTIGALYFNEYDELMVLNRNGKVTPLLSSSLSQQLDRCVVYLDHAHTRGTDIKLPIGSRAAVTLGPKVTKDALVQGCMRMRKLGHGHSIMFFAPPEVDRNIRTTVAKTDPSTEVTTVDILRWAIHETCTDIQKRAPSWAQQGMSHRSRYDSWTNFAEGKLTRNKLGDAWLQPERKSLADLYASCTTEHKSGDLSTLDPEIRQRCKNLGVLSLPSAQMDEEQEREVNRHREREREVELPPEAEPAKHELHPAVVFFVKTGVIPPLSGFRPVFKTLGNNSSGAGGRDNWSPSVLATTDFRRTVKVTSSTKRIMDQYCRPVQWILSRNNDDQVLVLISPFEADRLMSDIKASEYIHLHLYAPRKSQRLKPADDFKLYTIPSLPSDWTPPLELIDEVNVFAGQLYLTNYEAYLRVCRLLGVPATRESRRDKAAQRNSFKTLLNFNRSSSSPLLFIKEVLAMRNKGMPLADTHMGRILQGQFLTEREFQQHPRAD